MPTRRPRYMITETDELSRALDDAARRWPEDGNRRSRLILRLVEEGHRALVAQQAENLEARRAAILATAGAATGAYEPGYLERLREDWPA